MPAVYGLLNRAAERTGEALSDFGRAEEALKAEAARVESGNAVLRAQLGWAKQEIARLRRENQQAAQRAFFLQPGLRVQLPGGREGTTIDERVQASVLLDGHEVAVRVDTRHLRYLATAPARVTVDGVDIGTARNIRLTSLEPDGTPVPYVLADRGERPDDERPPFHHERGNPSDYLEALAEEIHNGPRQVERFSTVAEGSVLNVMIRFGIPPVRGALTDLLYVAEG